MAYSQPVLLDGGYQQSFLYAVSEVEQYQGQAGGAIVSFRADGNTEKVTLVNEQPTKGGLPCHLSVDKSNKILFVANYSGGSIAMFPIEADGSLGPMCDFVQHEGNGLREDRQEAPHPHSVFLYGDDRNVFVPDLGLDKVMIYLIDYEKKKFKLQGEAILPPGAGPRHLVFHPNGMYVYVINELNSMISVFSIDIGSCVLRHLQDITTLPDDYDDESTGADIHITSDGRFLYASNRGHDSLAIYQIDGTDGKLVVTGYSPSYGMTPRNFAITPNGKFILVANQDSNCLQVLAIDSVSGSLSLLFENTISISKPSCVKVR